MRAILSIVPGRRAIAACSIASMLVAASCGGTGAGRPAEGGADAPSATALSVVVSFYPLAYAAERVGGDAVSVTDLTPPGTEPHDLELTPDDLVSIAEADVVVYLGEGFQTVVEDAVVSEATGATVDAFAAVDPPTSSDGGIDPHVWLDPTLFAEIVDAVAAALGDALPAEAQTFLANARSARDDLATLDREFRRGLAQCASRVMITNHAAFGYLAAAYDLRQEAISGLSPESEPDAARIAMLAAEAEAAGVTTVFTEELVSPEVAESLAAEAGLETAVLSPLEGLTEAQIAAGDDYLSAMRRNLEVLRDGLVCA
ncbi:MAG: metal ABC transporter solute-binding protein, Zn/Mn family [Actinomycetota bacterium]